MSYGLIGDWKYNKHDGVYYWGTPQNGCGVFRINGLYTGNVIVRGNWTILGNYATVDEAKKEAVRVYKERRLGKHAYA